MPVYRNDTSETRTPSGGLSVFPGRLLVTQKYLRDPDGLTLIEHGLSPIQTLHKEPPPASLTGLAKYGQIIIDNQSGNDITLVFNEDDEAPVIVHDRQPYPIEQELDIETLDITGDGVLNVYVYGLV